MARGAAPPCCSRTINPWCCSRARPVRGAGQGPANDQSTWRNCLKSPARAKGRNPGVRSGNASGGGLRAERARPGAGAGSSRRRSASQITPSGVVGARLGCAGSTSPASRPRCARIRSVTAGASILAMGRKRPPHCRQISISMVKTRLRRCAPVGARCRSLVDVSPRSLTAAARVLGTIRCSRLRSSVLGAGTGTNRRRSSPSRRSGTTPASRAPARRANPVSVKPSRRNRCGAPGSRVVVSGSQVVSTLGQTEKLPTLQQSGPVLK